MHSKQFKSGVFLIEALNSFATTYFFYYLYFFTQSKFAFDKRQNFLLAAGMGLIYAVGSALGGRFAQRHGYFRSLKIGSAIMMCAFAIGSRIDNFPGQLVIMVVANAGMSLTWPPLQALISEGEPRHRLQNMVGIYNVVWSVCGAIAYLTGGAMIESWGLRILFIVPVAICLAQLMLLIWFESLPAISNAVRPSLASVLDPQHATDSVRTLVQPATFLKMAWLANPFAYLTINTVIAVSPSIAQILHLSPRYAGYVCSTWMFVRTAAFVLFWLWPGWHYRFRWLLNAYLGMIASFLAILLAPNVPLLIAVQIGFGLCVGLIYYSSLFYSMDVGETKGEHGGLHEAAIGVGSCTGPAIGAAALYLAPANPGYSTFAVGILLTLGLAGLLRLRYSSHS